MEELMITQYAELKSRLDAEMNAAAQSFIHIGYLLKLARDNADILAGSGYSDVADFARAEYGLDRSQVSRFIRINERFGNGAALREQYEGFGSSKLSEMLMLPDMVADELPAEASKSEIRALAADLAEDEKAVSDLEIAMEDHSDESIWLQAFREYFRLRPAEYVMLAEQMEAGYPTIALMDVMAPNGISMKTIRLSGVGKVTVSFRGNRPPVLVNVRSGEREEKEIGQLAAELEVLFAQVKDLSARGAWSMLYQEPFPQDEEENIKESEPVKGNAAEAEAVAPVQQAEEQEETEEEPAPEPEKRPKTEKKAAETPKSAPKKQKVVDIVKPKERAQEPHRAAEEAHPKSSQAEKEEKEPVPENFMNPPEPEEETEPSETGEAPDEMNEDPAEAEINPVTPHEVVLGEIRRCCRLLGESVDEARWARARGFLAKIREHIDRIEAMETEEDKAQMNFRDFPEILPEKQEEEE